jgi:hypothetical protein
VTEAAQDRDALLRRYAELVRTVLPAAAAREGWSLRADHCFGRVLLDDAVGACWYSVLDRRAGAAYRQLDDAQLAHAVATGERVLAQGDALLRTLDARSLAWRGKPPKRTAGAHGGAVGRR